MLTSGANDTLASSVDGALVSGINGTLVDGEVSVEFKRTDDLLVSGIDSVSVIDIPNLALSF